MAFAKGGRSAFYGSAVDARPLGTIEAFQAFGNVVPQARNAWLNRLGAVNREALCGILERVPPERMSETCRQFTLELLLTNQQRLLE